MKEFTRKDQIELRSEEVQEIISQMPSWTIRWGISVIFFVILSLIFISWFIQYPDILMARVIITTQPPPQTVVARANGNLILLNKENETANTGKPKP